MRTRDIRPIKIIRFIYQNESAFFTTALCLFLSLLFILVSGPGAQALAANVLKQEIKAQQATKQTAAQPSADPKTISNIDEEAIEPPGVSRVLDVWEKQRKKYAFNPVDRNDPFLPLVLPEKEETTPSKTAKQLTPLQKIDLPSLKLVAVITSKKTAQALVEDTTGTGYIVKIGTYMGSNDGQVVGIYPALIGVREGMREVIQSARIEVREKYRSYLGTVRDRIVVIPLKGEEK